MLNGGMEAADNILKPHRGVIAEFWQEGVKVKTKRKVCLEVYIIGADILLD